jgi:hypothetical protein
MRRQGFPWLMGLMILQSWLVSLRYSSRSMSSVMDVGILRLRFSSQKTQMISLKCAACGFVSYIDMRDKLTTFILKNPPEQNKGGKDKKAMRRAEKERDGKRDSRSFVRFKITIDLVGSDTPIWLQITKTRTL